MLKQSYYVKPTALDLKVFAKLVPDDHYLRQVKSAVDFEPMREKVQAVYDLRRGRPALDPIRLLKLGFVQWHYGLSDREVLNQLRVNVAFRYFLDLSLDSPVPTVGLLSQFRSRLGVELHQELFDEVLSQARKAGLVKDRLRLKDATHVLANIAVPTTLGLVAQVREALLCAMSELVPQQVEVEREEAERLRNLTAELSDKERLLHRVEHLRRLVIWSEQIRQRLESTGSDVPVALQRVSQVLEIAHHLLRDQDEPGKGDRLVSLIDPDARCGKHGKFFDGYLLDVSIDADSELLCRVDVLPANADEAKNAEKLIGDEEQRHGNDVEALSIDGIGFRGDVLQTLTDPQGLALEVTVPPHPASARPDGFGVEQFTVTEEGEKLICPAGQSSSRRERAHKNNSWRYTFRRSQCAHCPLLAQCMPNGLKRDGRQVTVNDYAKEYEQARRFAQTPKYAEVRREHPKVERKLSDLVRNHRMRRARYRGRRKVKIQALLSAVAANIKRMVRLLFNPPVSGPKPACAGL